MFILVSFRREEEIMNYRTLSVVLILSVIIFSCSPLLKMHHETDPMHIAVLNKEEHNLAKVEYIDGEMVEYINENYVMSFSNKWIFEVSAGQHEVQVSYRDFNRAEYTQKTKRFLVKFNALPKHLYSLICHVGSNYSGGEIIDVTDEAIKAVKANKDMVKWSWTKEYIDIWQLK
jgi:hypothetical protein